MMPRKNIPGRLDYAALAVLNRPSDPNLIAAEIRRLHTDQHLSARDIATALRLDITAVMNSLNLSNIKETTI